MDDGKKIKALKTLMEAVKRDLAVMTVIEYTHREKNAILRDIVRKIESVIGAIDSYDDDSDIPF